MKIGQKFNELTFNEYFFYIENHKKCKDFNTLALYRSILENEKLSLSEKIEVRDHANKFFQKSFDFLQIKDPNVFFELVTLGKDFTVADQRQVWSNIRKNQEKILKKKRIKHRNFGVYSKHDCGSKSCYMTNVMVKQGSIAKWCEMYFESDKSRNGSKLKSLQNKKDRKNEKQIINKLLESE